MADPLRLVVDTNVVISGALVPASLPGRALDHAVECGRLLLSSDVLAEYRDTLFAPKFERYVPRGVRATFLRDILLGAEWIEDLSDIVACRDLRDDRFLALAVAGDTDFVVTGDGDLLALHPFRGIPIVTPRRFMELVAS